MRVRFARRTPSPRYSGERVGERGERRSTSRIVRFADQRDATNRAVFDSTRTSPLSPALSSAYWGEGERFLPALRHECRTHISISTIVTDNGGSLIGKRPSLNGIAPTLRGTTTSGRSNEFAAFGSSPQICSAPLTRAGNFAPSNT